MAKFLWPGLHSTSPSCSNVRNLRHEMFRFSIHISMIIQNPYSDLFNELTAGSECDMAMEEYIDFDVATCSSSPAINSDMVDWRVS